MKPFYLLFIPLIINCVRIDPVTGFQETSPVENTLIINHYPVIAYSGVIGSRIATSDTARLYCVADDQDGDSLSYTWSTKTGTFAGDTTGDSVQWIAPDRPGTCTLTCSISDGRDAILNFPMYCTVYPEVDTGALFLVATQSGVMLWAPPDKPALFMKGRYSIQTYQEEAYLLQRSTIKVCNRFGIVLRSIELNYGNSFSNFTILPSHGFATYANTNDSVFFFDTAGSFTFAVGNAGNISPYYRKHYGVATEDELFVADNGLGEAIAININDRTSSVLKDLIHLPGDIGGIAMVNDTFYVCCSSSLYSFTRATPPRQVAYGNEDDVAVRNGDIYICNSNIGTIEKVDQADRTFTIMVHGLDRPDQIAKLH